MVNIDEIIKIKWEGSQIWYEGAKAKWAPRTYHEVVTTGGCRKQSDFRTNNFMSKSVRSPGLVKNWYRRGENHVKNRGVTSANCGKR